MQADREIRGRKAFRGFFSTSAGAVVQTLAAKILLLATNVGTGVITARNLEPSGRGILAALVLCPSLFSGLLTFGVPIALSYESRRNPSREAEMLSSSVMISAIAGLVAMIIGVCLIPRILIRYDHLVIIFAQWLMIAAPLALIMFVLHAALEARGEFTVSNLSKTLPQIVTLASILILIVLDRLTPYSAACAYTVPLSIVPMLLAWKLRKVFSLNVSGLLRATKRILSFGLRSYPIDVLNTLSTQIDQVLVVGLLSAERLGLYVVALSVSRVLGILHLSLLTVLFPKAASLGREGALELTGRMARLSTFASSVACAGFIPAIPLLLSHLYGKAFAGVSAVAQILCIEMLLSGTASVLSQAFTATGRPGIVAILQILGLSLAVPLMFLFIPSFGLPGAALALLASSGFRLLMTALCFPLVLKTALPNLIVTRDDLMFIRSRLQI